MKIKTVINKNPFSFVVADSLIYTNGVLDESKAKPLIEKFLSLHGVKVLKNIAYKKEENEIQAVV